MKKVSLFFGAGAEMSYGLPSGGQFAVEIFRKNSSNQKEHLRNVLKNIDKGSVYATDWLPESFWDKNISVFGSREFGKLIESSVEYRKKKIQELLNNFDDMADKAMSSLEIDPDKLNEKFKALTTKSIGDNLYTQYIKVNKILSQENFPLFSSEYYSAALDILKTDQQSFYLQKLASSFLQLLVAAYGQDLIQNLNQEIFSEAPDDIPIFDEVTGLFQMEYSRAGLTALEILLKEKREIAVTDESSVVEIFSAIYQTILEDLFAEILDYQSLIDSHFRYLFCPKTEWAKFTRMVIFLHIVREYIMEAGEISDSELQQKEGYYSDIKISGQHNVEINAIGSANYNNLVERVLKLNDVNIENIYHLNGSTHDFYDPFKNRTEVFEGDLPDDYIYVPFLFTQSGLKPLTSIGMSKRYVNLFNEFSHSDAIVSIGYGFNSDDGHINGLLRELVESDNKTLFVVEVQGGGTETTVHKDICKKLRVTKNKTNVKVIFVDKENRQKDETLWLEYIANQINSNNE